MSRGVPLISVIIPALDESSVISASIQAAQQARNVEIIVADGGSRDGTREIARRSGAGVVGSPPGRAKQMNAGADAAGGEILLFLHADTLLPGGYDAHVRKILSQPGVAAGAFLLEIDSGGLSLRFIEACANLRSRWLKMPYGDQAIFLASGTFHEAGGFPGLPLMEDFEFMRCLKARGRVEIAPVAVTTSARRWRKLGICRTTIMNQGIIVAYLMGVSPARLAKWYDKPPKISLTPAGRGSG